MVEFISELTERQELDIPDEPEQAAHKPLEEMVEEQIEELHALQSEQVYIDEPSNSSGEYHHLEHAELQGPELKHELRPLVYDDNEQIIVVDIFEKYGKNEPADDKWWKRNKEF